ncbi:MAG: hypothetical protein H6626_13810 [Pseudobdellovibrionaceae bacterium]|nr:hypothetical protein [Bdellovibrionales bacterium]USN47246.1 MAG: hypothetical protein H6626_13810 [Pseudobdellovibrionaceae bacterium]
MDLDGNFYATYKYHESSDGPDGVLEKINNDSGHYGPDGEHHQQVYDQLRKLVGYDFSHLRVDPEELQYTVCAKALLWDP